MYNWDLSITRPEGTFYVFSADNENGCSFMIEAGDIGSGTHRIINLILCDCPNAFVYVSDETCNRCLIESIMNNRSLSFSFE